MCEEGLLVKIGYWPVSPGYSPDKLRRCAVGSHHADKICHCLALCTAHPNQRRKNTMSKTNGKAQAIAQTYVNAIANKDIDTIISISTDDVICSSPMGMLNGAETFRGFQDGFARMLTNVTILAVGSGSV